MKEWIGKVYPRGSKAKDFLRLYTQQFNTIELNTTHYRIPDPATIENWRNQSADDFKFCPKVPQTISHRANLGMADPQLRQFWDAVAGLEEKLGCCFIQLPPNFSVDKKHLLEQFLQTWPSSIPLAVELRHPSWYTHPDQTRSMLELLARHQKAAVITDVAGRRDVLHMGLSHPISMIRFVGNDLHETDYQRIDAWVQRLENWYQKGLQRVYFFTHEPDNIRAPELAAYLMHTARRIPGLQLRGPDLDEIPGDQLSLF
jgi:uncharacterized protein YecE (DUF72 family)